MKRYKNLVMVVGFLGCVQNLQASRMNRFTSGPTGDVSMKMVDTAASRLGSGISNLRATQFIGEISSPTRPAGDIQPINGDTSGAKGPAEEQGPAVVNNRGFSFFARKPKLQSPKQPVYDAHFNPKLQENNEIDFSKTVQDAIHGKNSQQQNTQPQPTRKQEYVAALNTKYVNTAQWIPELFTTYAVEFIKKQPVIFYQHTPDQFVATKYFWQAPTDASSNLDNLYKGLQFLEKLFDPRRTSPFTFLDANYKKSGYTTYDTKFNEYFMPNKMEDYWQILQEKFPNVPDKLLATYLTEYLNSRFDTKSMLSTTELDFTKRLDTTLQDFKTSLDNLELPFDDFKNPLPKDNKGNFDSGKLTDLQELYLTLQAVQHINVENKIPSEHLSYTQLVGQQISNKEAIHNPLFDEPVTVQQNNVASWTPIGTASQLQAATRAQQNQNVLQPSQVAASQPKEIQTQEPISAPLLLTYDPQVSMQVQQEQSMQSIQQEQLHNQPELTQSQVDYQPALLQPEHVTTDALITPPIIKPSRRAPKKQKWQEQSNDLQASAVTLPTENIAQAEDVALQQGSMPTTEIFVYTPTQSMTSPVISTDLLPGVNKVNRLQNSLQTQATRQGKITSKTQSARQARAQAITNARQQSPEPALAVQEVPVDLTQVIHAPELGTPQDLVVAPKTEEDAITTLLQNNEVQNKFNNLGLYPSLQAIIEMLRYIKDSFFKMIGFTPSSAHNQIIEESFGPLAQDLDSHRKPDGTINQAAAVAGITSLISKL